MMNPWWKMKIQGKSENAKAIRRERHFPTGRPVAHLRRRPRVQLKVEKIPCQAKHKRKKLMHSLSSSSLRGPAGARGNPDSLFSD
jgi:hypothetical protein